MFSGIKNIFTYLPAIVLIILAGLSLHYYNQADEWHDKADAAAKERDEALFILSNQVRMVNIINDIAKANENERNRISNNGEVRAAAIKKEIGGDECATRPVPAAAADLLRKHANQIRSGATGTDTNKLTF
ncbi:TPA: exotoxin [Yersinia enterocolitica]|nr:exotoxin [Yersinia enterocolitica]HEF8857413.1 exotoxin [Yersinia enterocolitica]HEN3229268.1 exotoxin [Yersinia enterocolitica]HEN3381322.1 exotoxin [Yersinia enterocolitica]HEN3528166.1 exotoxin [Yersinia enterocolitica]